MKSENGKSCCDHSQKLTYFSEIPNAPKAIGPYSPAVVAGGFAFISGQIPLDPNTGKIVEGGIESQVTQVLNNLAATLSGVGADFNAITKTTIFVTDLGDFQVINKIYGERLGSAKPARSTIQVAALPLGAKVEIEAIARL